MRVREERKNSRELDKGQEIKGKLAWKEKGAVVDKREKTPCYFRLF